MKYGWGSYVWYKDWLVCMRYYKWSTSWGSPIRSRYGIMMWGCGVIRQGWGDIIIIIVKTGRHCKAERESYTHYQSEDLSPTIPTYRQKEEKGKNSIRLASIGIEQLRPIKNIGSALETRQFHTIEYWVCKISFQRDTEMGSKVLRRCEVLQLGGT